MRNYMLCLCLLISSMMSQVRAQRSGTCGGNLTWELNDDYTVLTVRGTGEMDNYGSDYNTAPWHAYCEEIKEVILNDGITRIGDWAFFMCRNMDAPTIPNTVQSIGDGAFCGCSSMQSFDIPNSVESIGNKAFEGCERLTYVHIGEGVKELGQEAFWMCSGLTSVVIPDSVTILGASLFSRCSSLQEMTVLPTEPPTFERLFYYPTYNPLQGVPSRIPVYVPMENLEAYQTADDWKSMNLQPIGSTSVQTATALASDIVIAGNEVLLPVGLDAEVQVYDMNGRLVLNTTESSFSLHNKGLYVIKAGNEVVKVTLQ